MPDLSLTVPVYINLDPGGPVLVKSSTNQLPLGPLRVVSGDERLFSFRLHQTPEGSTWQRVGLPSGWTMVLSGKRAPGGETAYFTNSTWATVGSGSTLAYTATLDWAVSDSVWANAPDGVVPFRMDIEIRDSGNTVRGTVQFDLELSRENYGSGDTPDDPDSPFLDRTAGDNIYLSFEAAQTLTSPQQTQALTNLGFGATGRALRTAATAGDAATSIGLGTTDDVTHASLTTTGDITTNGSFIATNANTGAQTIYGSGSLIAYDLNGAETFALYGASGAATLTGDVWYGAYSGTGQGLLLSRTGLFGYDSTGANNIVLDPETGVADVTGLLVGSGGINTTGTLTLSGHTLTLGGNVSFGSTGRDLAASANVNAAFAALGLNSSTFATFAGTITAATAIFTYGIATDSSCTVHNGTVTSGNADKLLVVQGNGKLKILDAPKTAVTALTNITDNASTSITLSSSDSGGIIRCTAATAVTITVPTSLPASFSVLVIQAGAGQITFTPSGTTINSYGSLTKTAGQHAMASLLRVAADTFNLSGNLA